MISRALAALLLVCSFLMPARAATQRPHIVLVMADDQGWGDMAYNGHPVLKTPHFDKAAASGLRFDRFHAAAPVCSPTRASVMTGRHPNRMGVWQWGYPLRPQEHTIAEALRTAGYTTAHFGKWHLGSVRNASPTHPGHHGFDHWLSAPNFYDNDPILSENGKAVQLKGESSVVTATAAMDWIGKAAQGDQPLFAVVWFGSPHAPHRAIQEDQDLYPDQPANLRNFYGEVTGMDRAFGQIRDGLEKLGIRQDTILWYCSDNGGLPKVGSTGPFRGNKGNVYEGGLLVPAILEWPRVIDQPRTTLYPANTCDILPTLLDLLGLQRASNLPILDGISLKGLVRNTGNPPARSMGFWHSLMKGISTPSDAWMSELLAAQAKGGDLPPHESSARVRELPNPPHPLDSFPGESAWHDSEWKLIRREAKGGKVSYELYNLLQDPEEKQDQAKSHPEQVEALKPRLTAWLKSVVRSYNGEDYPEGSH